MGQASGTIILAIGGAILLLALYVAITAAQSPYGNIGPIIGFVSFGVLGFLLFGIGLFVITKSAVAEAQSQTKKG